VCYSKKGFSEHSLGIAGEMAPPNPTMAATDHYLIVGGGPVGFATALLLAKKGIRSTVFEGRDAVINIPEESYPIGVNARGLHTMELIDPAVAQECRDTGKIINSWQIFGGKSKVAHLDSGVVYGTSRARVNLILAEAATRAPFSQLITIENNHRLRDVRLAERELVFDVRQADGTSKRRVVEVPEGSRVVASDGVNSAARRAMEAQDKSFQSKVTNWKNEVRPHLTTSHPH
jgi:2-polyprenyl-6-methoxyphenol hydroxylase-like FAD-dependent oxidoreductase